MRPSDFDFELPQAQIAQTPPAVRGASRLLVLGRSSGELQHRQFADLPEFLREGDVLVLNDTRVVPARLIGRKVKTGGRAELLLARPAASVLASAALGRAGDQTAWICLGQASKGLKAGTELAFGGGLSAVVHESRGAGEYLVAFHTEANEALARALEKAGRVPLPPYIEREPTSEDAERYQTVYASVPGSVAAPTAGLHFTDELLNALQSRGVQRVAITLEVGPGTFLPVREEDVERHVMHPERFWISPEVSRLIAAARRQGRRVIAVGTTSARTLESAWDATDQSFRAGAGETTLFIRPGHEFRAFDALLTNFHLPRSTLLMLVSAFARTDRVLAAYREAVVRGYRFFSYGDAMFIGDPPDR
jgi:S-adenosylmethionine:tRNA ribosyltransferase-isomerase